MKKIELKWGLNMEKYREVMIQTTNLLETVHEGLQHIQKLLIEGKFENTLFLLEDIILAFGTIENSLQGLKNEILPNDIQHLTCTVREALDLTVLSYESENYSRVQGILQSMLIPQFVKWKRELETSYSQVIVS